MYFAEASYSKMSPAKMQGCLQSRVRVEKEAQACFEAVAHFEARAIQWYEHTVDNYYVTNSSTIHNECNKVVTLSNRMNKLGPALSKVLMDAKVVKDDEYVEHAKMLQLFHAKLTAFCKFFIEDLRDMMILASAVAKTYREDMLIPGTDSDLAKDAVDTAMAPLELSLPARMQMFERHYPPQEPIDLTA
jgi:hypothetical protein